MSGEPWSSPGRLCRVRRGQGARMRDAGAVHRVVVLGAVTEVYRCPEPHGQALFLSDWSLL